MLIWHVTEAAEELEQKCVKHELTLPVAMHLESRRNQVMATSLLHRLLIPGTILSYETTGKPLVNNGQFVSITHCGDMLVMMRSDSACGVDIERIHPRVRKVRRKFLNDEELELTRDASDFTLTQYWTAKEAMFKVYGSDEVFMRSNIFVSHLSETESIAELKDASLEIKRKIRFQIIDDMILAWTELI